MKSIAMAVIAPTITVTILIFLITILITVIMLPAVFIILTINIIIFTNTISIIITINADFICLNKLWISLFFLKSFNAELHQPDAIKRRRTKQPLYWGHLSPRLSASSTTPHELLQLHCIERIRTSSESHVRCLIYVFTVSELRLKTCSQPERWAKRTDSSFVIIINTSAVILIHMLIICMSSASPSSQHNDRYHLLSSSLSGGTSDERTVF